MNFFIRTNFSSSIGTGHLIRCKRLTNEIKKRGHNCFFFLDKSRPPIELNHQTFFIYSGSNSFKSEMEDAKIFCEKTKMIGPGIVIADDYRLGLIWEKKASKFHKKVIIFDDKEDKQHYADLVINYNPKNYPVITYDYSKNLKENCNFLIHPKYNIIEQKSFSDRKIKKNKFFQVLLYIGGGGDLLKIYKLLLEIIKNNYSKKNIEIKIIIGPLAKNKNKIINLAKKHKNLQCIESPNNIYDYLKNANLFIGSAGTSIFESALFKVPSILIQMSKNQSTNIFSLEKLGQYFFLKSEDLFKFKYFSELINIIFKNYTRVQLLNKNPKVKIDDKGCKRIANYIFQNKYIEKFKIYKNNFYKKKESKLKIISVEDSNINHYLYSRNLFINRNNSYKKNIISTLKHYIWWFSTSRKSYALLKGEEKILYIYEEPLFKYLGKQYLLSGWFACSKNCSLKEIIFALNWQKNKYSNKTKWVSFVKNTNKPSLILSKYIGWQVLKNKDKVLVKTKTLLKIKNKRFTFYER